MQSKEKLVDSELLKLMPIVTVPATCSQRAY
jgi:hypothetical protein